MEGPPDSGVSISGDTGSSPDSDTAQNQTVSFIFFFCYLKVDLVVKTESLQKIKDIDSFFIELMKFF